MATFFSTPTPESANTIPKVCYQIVPADTPSFREGRKLASSLSLVVMCKPWGGLRYWPPIRSRIKAACQAARLIPAHLQRLRPRVTARPGGQHTGSHQPADHRSRVRGETRRPSSAPTWVGLVPNTRTRAGRSLKTLAALHFRVWPSWSGHPLWEREVAGSSPATRTRPSLLQRKETTHG